MFSANASQAASGAGAANYIEDVFSTYLYTGNGSTQTITNGIDLSTYGGLVWTKVRSTTYSHFLADTIRGAGSVLSTNNTNAADTGGNLYSGFNTNGYGVTTSYGSGTNGNGATFASWTFRKQPKFFDVVTYTGNYTARTIAHSLGSVPGCIIVKKTSSADDWRVYHRSLATNQYMTLETTAAVGTSATMWNNTAPTSTVFSIGAEGSVNDPGETFVAYLFAHNAGGFGNTGTDNVISCGSYTGTGGTNTNSINLGYEPQWVLFKSATASVSGDWFMNDVMRGADLSNSRQLRANLSNAEGSDSPPRCYPTATGFNVTGNSQNASGDTYIYIAIRRGPMKTPTTGTSVFSPITANSPTGTKLTTNFPVDLSITQERTSAAGAYWMDRLRGALSPGLTGNTPYLQSSNTGAETLTTITSGWDNTGLNVAYFGSVSAVWWNFRRAPSFFDEVCYTGNGSDITINHNLGVPPELVITKCRNSSSVGGGYWYVGTTLASPNLYLNRTDAANNIDGYSGWTRTATTYQLPNADFDINNSGSTYVAYLFASCPGVSKVGSYSGTGATQTISCGFAARFVLIKRTDSTGDWWVWDTARGMVAGTDPRLPWNSASAETNANWVYTDASGFQIVTTDATVNASGGSYIYLAIA